MEAPNPEFMREAIRLSIDQMKAGHGGPFGAVVVKDGANHCPRLQPGHHHPRPHLPRRSRRHPQSLPGARHLPARRLRPLHQLRALPHVPRAPFTGPGRARVFYGNTKADAAAIGFDDQFIYEELDRPMPARQLPMTQLLRDEALAGFRAPGRHWKARRSIKG